MPAAAECASLAKERQGKGEPGKQGNRLKERQGKGEAVGRRLVPLIKQAGSACMRMKESAAHMYGSFVTFGKSRNSEKPCLDGMFL